MWNPVEDIGQPERCHATAVEGAKDDKDGTNMPQPITPSDQKNRVRIFISDEPVFASESQMTGAALAVLGGMQAGNQLFIDTPGPGTTRRSPPTMVDHDWRRHLLTRANNVSSNPSATGSPIRAGSSISGMP